MVAVFSDTAAWITTVGVAVIAVVTVIQALR